MTNYKLTCEILTPLHIGSGEEIEAYEYVIKERFYKINFFKLLSQLSPDQQEEFLAQSPSKQRAFLENWEDILAFSEYAVDITPAVQSLYHEKKSQDTSQLIVKPFIRSRGRPYIPGSSLKGAIRTAVIFGLLTEYPKTNYADRMEGEVLNCLTDWGRLDQAADPFRAVKVSDGKLDQGNTVIDRIQMSGMLSDSEDSQPHDLREITYSRYSAGRSSHKFQISMNIDEKLFSAKGSKMGKVLDFPLIQSSCDVFYSMVLEYDLQHHFRSGIAHDIYQQMLKEVNEDGNSFLLRVGWGSGFNSVTVNLKHPKPKWVKTRKITSDEIPLGWVKISR